MSEDFSREAAAIRKEKWQEGLQLWEKVWYHI